MKQTKQMFFERWESDFNKHLIVFILKIMFIVMEEISKLKFTCSKSTTEALEKGVKYAQS